MPRRHTQPQGILYYLACLSAVAALAVAFLPWPLENMLLQVVTIVGLIALAGVMLWTNQRDSPRQLRLQTLSHLFLVGGVIFLPLENVPEYLKKWLFAISLTSLVLYGYFFWRQRSEEPVASPPPGDY